MGGNVDMQIKRKKAKLVEQYYHSFQSVEVKQIEDTWGTMSIFIATSQMVKLWIDFLQQFKKDAT